MRVSIFFYGILVCGILSKGVNGQQGKPADRYKDAYKAFEHSVCPIGPDSIRHFVYFARDRELIHEHPFLKVKRLEGAQIMYAWKQLEPQRGQYDFSLIQEDYDYLLSQGKKLFIQLQDATFSIRNTGVPDYLLTPEFDGGITRQFNDQGEAEGWVAKRWNPEVRRRFALLLQALGKAFDGKAEGINLQETAIGVTSSGDSTFSPRSYLEGIKTNMLAMKKAFPRSVCLQYANFMPGEWLPRDDKGYLRAVYQFGEENGIGLGGPDLLVRRQGQLNHCLALMHESLFTVPLGIAVQDGNYTAQTGEEGTKAGQIKYATGADRENLVPMLHAFAKNFLRVNYIFWVYEEPYFSTDVIPCLRD